MSLELATTTELIEELFNRTTFAGVLLYSATPHKQHGQIHKEFCLRSSTENDSTIFLLEKGIEALKNQVTEHDND